MACAECERRGERCFECANALARNAEELAPKMREARIKELEEWRPLLIEYTRQKLVLGDWHGVADGAMDLRDLDSELDGLKY